MSLHRTQCKPLIYTTLYWSAIPVSLVFLYELTAILSQATAVGIDHSALSWMHSRRTPLLDDIFIAITWIGSAFVLLPASVVVTVNLVKKGRWLEVWLLGLGLIGAMLMTQAAKTVFSRPRPELFDPLVTMPASWSFPSGHATQIVAFALCLVLIVYPSSSPALRRFITLAGILMATGVGFSRIYLQVHYPSDVLAGGMLAILWVAGLYTLLRGFANTSSSRHSLS